MTTISPDEAAFIHECRTFARREIAPLGPVHDREAAIDRAIITEVGRRGYLTPFLPIDCGGRALGMRALSLLHQEFGRHCAALRSLLTVHGMVARSINRFGSDRQRHHWLPRLACGRAIAGFALSEPEAGSDASAIATSAIPNGRGWWLSGTKTWISFAQIAELFLVFARTPVGISAFLAEAAAPNLTISPIEGLSAARGSMAATIELRGVEVGPEALVGSEGFGFALVAGDALTFGRLSVAAATGGIIADCLERSTEFARARRQFGRPLDEHQLIAAKLSRMLVAREALMLLCQDAATAIDRGDPRAGLKACIAKQFGATACATVVRDAIQIHGARGCLEETGLVRHLRDAAAWPIIEGSTEILDVLIADAASCNTLDAD